MACWKNNSFCRVKCEELQKESLDQHKTIDEHIKTIEDQRVVIEELRNQSDDEMEINFDKQVRLISLFRYYVVISSLGFYYVTYTLYIEN